MRLNRSGRVYKEFLLFFAGSVVSRLAITLALPASEQELKSSGEKNAIIALHNGLFSRVVMGQILLTNKRTYELFIS